MSGIELTGNVAIVTGAGGGLGRAHSLELARRGASVLVCDISEEGAAAVVKEIVDVGGTAVPAVRSVATPEGGQAIVEQAVRELGGVQIVVNNAGFVRPEYFGEMSMTQIKDVIDVHLYGAFWVTQPAWAIMKEQAYGRVVMTSSSAGFWGLHASSNYAAAKGAIFGLAATLAIEGREHGIKVNTIVPLAATAIQREHPIPDVAKYMGDAVALTNQGSADPATAAIVAEFTARRRAELVAPLVAYLASRECEITGEAISAVAGRFGRLFAGVCDGWLAPDIHAISAEAIRDHLAEIRDTGRFSVPVTAAQELTLVAASLAGSS